jgi:hypothetical protein
MMHKKFSNNVAAIEDVTGQHDGYRAFAVQHKGMSHWVWIHNDTVMALIEAVNKAWETSKRNKFSKMLYVAPIAYGLERSRVKTAEMTDVGDEVKERALQFQNKAWGKVKPVLKNIDGVAALMESIKGTNSNATFDRLAVEKALDVMFMRFIVIILEDKGIFANIPVLRAPWSEE